MKKRIAGLGIFALVFSLNLFFSGTSVAQQASPVLFYAQPQTDQHHGLSDSGEIKLLNGILQQKTENTEQHHIIRKFPATLGLLFLLLNKNVEESPDKLFAADFSFTPSKDIPVAFHNLRI